MEQVISILETALPVFLALGLGMLCRKTGFLNREAVDALKKVVINLTLPAVLLNAFATAEYSAGTLVLPVLVYVLCCVALGLGYGDNTKAMLMTRGLTETARLGVAMGAKKESFAGLAGVGDLIVTCTSMHSRNRRAGILIGQGKGVQEAMQEVGAVVEGYYATKSAWELGQKMGVDMPIVQAAYRVLYEGATAKEVVRDLLTRPGREEQEDAGWL